MALGGPADEHLRMDAAGRGAADVGILRVAPGAEGETGHQDQKLGEPEDFDVCAGSGIRPYFALVAAGGAAFGQDACDDCTVSWISLRGFVGCDPGCGHGALLPDGDAQ